MHDIEARGNEALLAMIKSYWDNLEHQPNRGEHPFTPQKIILPLGRLLCDIDFVKSCFYT